MPYIKKILIILGILSSFVTLIAADLKAQDDKSLMAGDAPSDKIGASFRARVTAARAVVYADENMNSPLGFISNGKLITVGNPRKLNRELVPMVVYGRIGYVQIKDIHYENAEDEKLSSKLGTPREHDVDLLIKKPDEKLSENNSAYFSLHQFQIGDDLKNLFAAIDQEEKDSMVGVSAQFIHRQFLSRFFWGAGLEYASASSEHVSFAFYMINPTFGYTLMRNPLFLLDIYGSLDFTVSVLTDIDNNFESESGGFLWGPQLNARVVLFPERKYHLAAGAGLRKYRAVDLESFTDANEAEVAGVQDVGGLQFFLTLGMEF